MASAVLPDPALVVLVGPAGSGLDPQRRRAQLSLARKAGLPAVAVLFGTVAVNDCPRPANSSR